MALLTLFPDEEPRGQWILHDGVGFDYDKTVAILSDPAHVGPPPVQMYTFESSMQRWFPSTNHPNTLAHVEKFNYRRPLSGDPEQSVISQRGCYDGRRVEILEPTIPNCVSGEMVVQYRRRGSPNYVFWPFYSVATGVTLFKQFNDSATDPDAFVAMRLVYSGLGAEGTRHTRDEYFNSTYQTALRSAVAQALAAIR